MKPENKKTCDNCVHYRDNGMAVDYCMHPEVNKPTCKNQTCDKHIGLDDKNHQCEYCGSFKEKNHTFCLTHAKEFMNNLTKIQQELKQIIKTKDFQTLENMVESTKLI